MMFVTIYFTSRKQTSISFKKKIDDVNVIYAYGKQTLKSNDIYYHLRLLIHRTTLTISFIKYRIASG